MLCLLGIAVTYGAFSAWQEWAFRNSLAAPVPVMTTVTQPPPRAVLDPAAVAAVLGLTAGTPLLPSAEPLTLQASFVSGTTLSKALLAGAQGSRIYQVGDPLPGGSVLRRVEANRAVLWNKGREEVLMLQPTADFLHRLDPQGEVQAPTIPARFLRPQPRQSE